MIIDYRFVSYLLPSPNAVLRSLDASIPSPEGEGCTSLQEQKIFFG
jgi:hypothetical protein